MTLLAAPNSSLVDAIVTRLNKAQTRLYLNVYILTEKKLVQALLSAKKRGIDVRVILEKNVYKAPNLNLKVFEVLKKGDISTVWDTTK
jgi:cardiolipin synthase A/B